MGTRVVIADDAEDVRIMLRAVLDQDGRFDVVGEAGDGREAVEVVDTTRPDVAVLDLRMPNMDGLEAAVQIADVSPTTRVVVYSAVEGPQTRAAAEAAGAVSFLPKGASVAVIADTVARAAAGS